MRWQLILVKIQGKQFIDDGKQKSTTQRPASQPQCNGSEPTHNFWSLQAQIHGTHFSYLLPEVLMPSVLAVAIAAAANICKAKHFGNELDRLQLLVASQILMTNH